MLLSSLILIPIQEDFCSLTLKSETSPVDVMNPLFQSCGAFDPRNATCTLGVYPNYSINVSSAQDVIAGLQFARQYDIRLVIKNTGHE